MAAKVPYLPINEFRGEDITSSSNIDDENAALLFPSDSHRGTFSKEITLILCGMGMGNYVELFTRVNINLETFLQLNDEDLEHLGIKEKAHRDIIAAGLTFQPNKIQKKTVDKDPNYEDMIIARNVMNHLFRLESNIAYTNLQMKKVSLTDYFVSDKDTAVTVSLLLLKKALKLSANFHELLCDDNKKKSVISTAIEVQNVQLSPEMRLKMTKLPKKRSGLKKMLTLIGIVSLSTVVGVLVKKMIPKK